VILNSIVQYFPDVDYLRDVLAQAQRVTRRGGQHLRRRRAQPALWDAFHESVESFRAPDLSAEELRQRVARAKHHERELLVDAAFFHDLGCGPVTVSPKGGAYDNELSRFRYDVTMRLGADPTPPGVRWPQPPPLSVEAAREHTKAAAAAAALHVSNVPSRGVTDADLGKALQEHLHQLLPDYMVPSAIVVLAAWPLTSSGKIDRQALPLPARQEEGYRAPRTAEEKLLCDLFAEVLSVERVGIEDGFFALGGDSIMSIQLVSRVRRAGLELTPRDVFQHQTVEALAAVVRRPEVAAPRDVDAGTGDVPLTPIVRWFLDHCAGARKFQQSMLLQAPDGITDEQLLAALQTILDTHDVLRLRLNADDTLRIEPRGAVLARSCFTRVSELDAAAVNAAEERLDPRAGRVLQVVADASGRVLVMIHHLAVDGVSWRIVLPDFEQALRGEPLEPVGTSFRAWAQHLERQAQSAAVLEELPAWEAILERGEPLVADAMLDPQRDTVASAGQLVVELSRDVTAALLTNVPAAFHARINDVLLTALAIAVERPILVELEGHGREPQDTDLDLSRTVGWFTSMFPVALDAGDRDVVRALKRVKEQLRAIPGQGLGYGLLASQLAAHDAAQIGFNYLGRFAVDGSTSTAVGGGADADMPLAHLLDINAQTLDRADGSTLTATWTWANAHLSEHDVRALADAWKRALEELVRAVEQGAHGHTPSDFPLVALSQEQVEQLEAAHPTLEDILPLSPLQEGFVFHALYDDAAPDFYTVQIAVAFDGPLDVPRLRAAAEALLRRHANLRAAIHHDGFARPIQVIAREVALPWLESDEDVLGAEHAKRFVLSEAPLLRLAVVRLAPERHLFALTSHHVLMDGWSVPIFFGELLALYRGDTLPRVRPYADYLRWLAKQGHDAAVGAWRDYLADVEPGVRQPQLPPSYATSRGTNIQERQLRLPHSTAVLPENLRGALSEELTSRLQSFARAHSLTLNTIVQGLWAVLLARLTGRDDVVFGVTVSGRPAELAGIEQMLGLFINALPLRARLDDSEPMTALLTRIQQSQSRMLAYQHVGLGEIQRATGATNLFDTLVVYENFPMDHAGLAAPEDGLRISATAGRDAVHFPLSLVVVPDQQLTLRLRYDPRLFTEERVQVLFAQLEVLAEQLVERPDASFRDYSLVTREQLLPDPNIELPKPEFEAVHATVARIAATHPNAEAIRHAGRSWNYAELLTRAEAIARSVTRGKVVPIEGTRSFETIASMLGAMLGGGVMLTLDPNLPPQRRELMLAQCEQAEINEDAAYIFFTSGSTGTPKGVLGSHQGLAHFIDWEARAFDVNANDRVAQLIHLSFDPSLRDIFLPLTQGATLCLPEREDEADGEHLLAWLQRERITLMHAVPSLTRWWLKSMPAGQHAPSLRWTLFAGEPLMGELAQQWRDAVAPNSGVANFYGPTETTLAKCAYRVPANATGLQPVGMPLPQTQALVVSRNGKLCGIGEPGEVVLRTPFRSLGYIPPPSSRASSEGPASWAGQKAGPSLDARDDGLGYFTGDAGRYLPDGSLEIIGRLDDQLKVRGVRIDPNEIASTLLAHPSVAECHVTACEFDGEKRLVAYVVATENERALLAFAAERLPESMIPSTIVVVPAMPLTRNGKLDRRALPQPEARNDNTRVPPRDAIELQLANLWKEILGLTDVGVHDDFFTLGGHSLPALRLVARIASELGVKLPAAAVFRHRTIEELAAALRVQTPWSPLVPIRARGSRPPLFCVHPQGGLALGYTDLARTLGDDQPFFGLQSVGMEEGQVPLMSVEAMAASYLDAMREVVPDGPYLLAGYSYGGRVAYEMAQQLTRAGAEVSLLALLDPASATFDPSTVSEVDDAALLINLLPPEVDLDVETLRRLDADEQMRCVVAKGRELGLVRPDFDVDSLRRFLAVYRSNITAGHAYRLAPYRGKITLFQTEERAGDDARAGWSALAMGGLEIRHVPGTHLTLMESPAVDSLGERLRVCIENLKEKP
jgi:amino acid adenylation domain-containing protein/non-ribosomal peptide synthase protein (TIGR01720 family)